jgi:hypothetical protein
MISLIIKKSIGDKFMIYPDRISSTVGLPLQDRLLALQARNKKTRESLLTIQRSNNKVIQAADLILKQREETIPSPPCMERILSTAGLPLQERLKVLQERNKKTREILLSTQRSNKNLLQEADLALQQGQEALQMPCCMETKKETKKQESFDTKIPQQNLDSIETTQAYIEQITSKIEKSLADRAVKLSEQQAKISKVTQDFAQIKEKQQTASTQFLHFDEQAQHIEQEMESLSKQLEQTKPVFLPSLVKQIHATYTQSLTKIRNLSITVNEKRKEIQELSSRSWDNITTVASETMEWTKEGMESIREMKTKVMKLTTLAYKFLTSANLVYWVAFGIIGSIIAQVFIYHHPVWSLMVGGSIAIMQIKYNLIFPSLNFSKILAEEWDIENIPDSKV